MKSIGVVCILTFLIAAIGAGKSNFLTIIIETAILPYSITFELLLIIYIQKIRATLEFSMAKNQVSFPTKSF